MIAIIPARGGSKGVPRKNIRPLGDKPLIFWTIEAALQAESIDHVILSTDNAEIADICRQTGIDIPFMRPKELAEDHSLAIDNYIYTMGRLSDERRYDTDEFAVLLPTVPFRRAQDIDAATSLFYEKQASSVISCTELPHPLDWVCDVAPDGKITKKENAAVEKMMNRQHSCPKYIPNGAIYVFNFSALKENYSYYSDRTYAYLMPEERSIDIDTELDFQFAQWHAELNTQ